MVMEGRSKNSQKQLNLAAPTKLLQQWFGCTSYKIRWGYNILFVSIRFSPAHDLDKIIWNTAPAAEVTAPNWKPWVEKSLERPAEKRTALNLFVTSERVSRRPYSKRVQDSDRDVPSFIEIHTSKLFAHLLAIRRFVWRLRWLKHNDNGN